ncbi:hypothetical protein DM01DRAFT_1339571 [Hesseltinella vesiculosa]|uniref:Uncharacterized protein n=1 Tax=Hesseltinella vesiculosa TaxID=101127 RepID=A0A1X2G813_9FUNG|nr:hypothetical protein DM01DRAFT_1339571 [Hesseltinella vesiculosa]
MASLVERIQSNADLYQRYCCDLQQEHGVAMALEEALTSKQELTERCQSLQANVHRLTENAKKGFSDLHKAKHFSFKSATATLAGRKKDLIAKQTTEYHHAFEMEQQAKRELESASLDLRAVTDKETSLTQQVDQFRAIRQQQESLIHEIFSEPDSVEPLETHLRVELQNYVDQLSLANRDLQRFKDVDHNLVQAIRQMKKAREVISLTLDYTPFDLFGEPLMDDQQIAYIELCQRACWEVQRRLNNARQILPEIPYPESLDIVTNNPMIQLQLHRNYVDIAWKAKVQQGYQYLVSGEKTCGSALQWVRQYLRYTEGAVDRLKVVLGATQANLLQERKRIIDKTLNQTSSSPVATAQLDDILDGTPPPMYEAPDEPASIPASQPAIPIDIPMAVSHQDHLLLSASPSSSQHLRTASQSSSVMDTRPIHPPLVPDSPPRSDHNPFRQHYP